MKLARRPAVKAFDRMALCVEARDQPVGAGWRPRLLNAELLDAADLGGLAIVESATERRTDPQMRRHVCHHPCTKGMLPKDELGELGSQRKERHPIVAVDAAARSAPDSRRNSSPALAAAFRRAIESAEAMLPGLADEDALPVMRDRDAGRPVQAVRQHAGVASAPSRRRSAVRTASAFASDRSAIRSGGLCRDPSVTKIVPSAAIATAVGQRIGSPSRFSSQRRHLSRPSTAQTPCSGTQTTSARQLPTMRGRRHCAVEARRRACASRNRCRVHANIVCPARDVQRTVDHPAPGRRERRNLAELPRLIEALVRRKPAIEHRDRVNVAIGKEDAVDDITR